MHFQSNSLSSINYGISIRKTEILQYTKIVFLLKASSNSALLADRLLFSAVVRLKLEQIHCNQSLKLESIEKY
jgi:hypothetical protein